MHLIAPINVRQRLQASGSGMCLRRTHTGLTGRSLLLRNFCAAISASPHVCFMLVLIFIAMILRCYIFELGIFHAIPRRQHFCFGFL